MSGWRSTLKKLAALYPRSVRLRPGVRPEELEELERRAGPTLVNLDPALPELLQLANGFEAGPYAFYPVLGESLWTIAFRTVFLWELNGSWRDRMILFAGDRGLVDVGVVRSYLERPCVGIVLDSGYELDETVPLASSLETFLGAFLEQGREVLERDGAWTEPLPSLAEWPPDLRPWFRRDPRLVRRIIAATREDVRRESGSYTEQIREAAETHTRA